MYDSNVDAREVLDLALKIEGNARHVGVHAAGVVIAPESVMQYSPIQLDPKASVTGDIGLSGKTITQYDMYSIADEYGGVGLLKFDFLGLTNLSVLADSIRRVKERLGVDVDLQRIPLDDKKVYDMLSRGETLGVFQMAGSGMTAYLKELKPSVVHDLNAMVALYRPGPMAFIPEYIERKKNLSRVRYLDPRLEAILKPTYGVLIYQDDVMIIAVELAGYSWGEADKFRKAMGKKIPEEMAAQKDRFTRGCIAHGMQPRVAQQLVGTNRNIRGIWVQQKPRGQLRQPRLSNGLHESQFSGGLHGGDSYGRCRRRRKDSRNGRGVRAHRHQGLGAVGQ
jgi:DNA polymerase-3 subunit alpha